MKYKKPIEVSAPAYTALLMEWIEQLLDNERVFPVAAGEPFPPDFVDTVRKIFRRLMCEISGRCRVVGMLNLKIGLGFGVLADA